MLELAPATDNGAVLSLTSARRPTTAQGFFELAPGDADSLGAKKFTFLAGNQRNARALAVRAPALALIIGELLRTPTATQPRCLRWLTAPIIAKRPEMSSRELDKVFVLAVTSRRGTDGRTSLFGAAIFSSI